MSAAAAAAAASDTGVVGAGQGQRMMQDSAPVSLTPVTAAARCHQGVCVCVCVCVRACCQPHHRALMKRSRAPRHSRPSHRLLCVPHAAQATNYCVSACHSARRGRCHHLPRFVPFLSRQHPLPRQSLPPPLLRSLLQRVCCKTPQLICPVLDLLALALARTAVGRMPVAPRAAAAVALCLGRAWAASVPLGWSLPGLPLYPPHKAGSSQSPPRAQRHCVPPARRRHRRRIRGAYSIHPSAGKRVAKCNAMALLQ
jgi:hypothetical protein